MGNTSSQLPIVSEPLEPMTTSSGTEATKEHANREVIQFVGGGCSTACEVCHRSFSSMAPERTTASFDMLRQSASKCSNCHVVVQAAMSALHSTLLPLCDQLDIRVGDSCVMFQLPGQEHLTVVDLYHLPGTYHWFEKSRTVSSTKLSFPHHPTSATKVMPNRNSTPLAIDRREKPC